MKFVDLVDTKTLEILECISDILYDTTDDFLQEHCENLSLFETDVHPTSDDYLYNALKSDENFDVPLHGLFVGLHKFEDKHTFYFSKQINLLTKKLLHYLGAQCCALNALYPDKGFIGWHTNANAQGYNLLFTYSHDGDGFFKYRDKDTGEIVTLPDRKGWSAKVGYYPSRTEEIRENQFWHCAYSNKKRITIAFVIPDKQMWELVIEHLQKDK